MRTGPQRRRVLLIRGDDAVDGHFDHIGTDIPSVGDVIDVRNRRQRGAAAIRARVEQVDEMNVLPIVAVEITRLEE